jgi:hypothetical protein
MSNTKRSSQSNLRGHGAWAQEAAIAGSPNEKTLVQLFACLWAVERKMPALCREAEGRTESEIRELIRARLIPTVDRFFPET